MTSSAALLFSASVLFALAVSPVPMAAALRYVSVVELRETGMAADTRFPVVALVLLMGAAVPLSLSWAGRDDGWAMLAACACGWLLVGIGLVDARLMIIPDGPVVALAVAAVLFWALAAPEALPDALAGAALGYGLLRGVDLAYRRWRGTAGLGGADPRLMAACGALLGWASVPTALLCAALTGLAAAGVRLCLGQTAGLTERIAFGPCLAAGTWLVWTMPPWP